MPFSNEQFLGAVEAGVIDFVAWDIEEIEIRLYDDVAVIRYLADLEVTFRGEAQAPGSHWVTVLYERRDGNWQAVWSHLTFAEPPPAATPMP